jgi:hypothetical protein
MCHFVYLELAQGQKNQNRRAIFESGFVASLLLAHAKKQEFRILYKSHNSSSRRYFNKTLQPIFQFEA